jgi:sugar fermentation stimulation protein A
MKYNNVKRAVFISRPNRFIAQVELDGKEETVHVKNTGRCKELLVPGATVWLEEALNPVRKTKYDLVAVLKEEDGKEPILINMDSQIVNDVAEEWFRKAIPEAEIKREVIYGYSRFDIYLRTPNTSAFVEVKGVTLEKNGVALFPDAPTQRGVKHIRELIKAHEEGYECFLLFVVQMKGVSEFRPNSETHPEFAAALKDAVTKGVHIIVMDCNVWEDGLEISEPIKKIIL